MDIFLMFIMRVWLASGDSIYLITIKFTFLFFANPFCLPCFISIFILTNARLVMKIDSFVNRERISVLFLSQQHPLCLLYPLFQFHILLVVLRQLLLLIPIIRVVEKDSESVGRRTKSFCLDQLFTYVCFSGFECSLRLFCVSLIDKLNKYQILVVVIIHIVLSNPKKLFVNQNYDQRQRSRVNLFLVVVVVIGFYILRLF